MSLINWLQENEESTVPIRVVQGDLAHPTCGGANQCRSVSEGELLENRDFSWSRGRRQLHPCNVLVLDGPRECHFLCLATVAALPLALKRKMQSMDNHLMNFHVVEDKSEVVDPSAVLSQPLP